MTTEDTGKLVAGCNYKVLGRRYVCRVFRCECCDDVTAVILRALDVKATNGSVEYGYRVMDSGELHRCQPHLDTGEMTEHPTDLTIADVHGKRRR